MTNLPKRNRLATRPSKDERLAHLIAQRPVTSAFEGAQVRDEAPHRNTDNWVRTWIDGGQRILHRDGKHVARRAITDEGQLIWMIDSPGRRYAFHADRQTPAEAFLQADEARQKRRLIAARWPEIAAMRHRVLLGRTRLTVLTQDAREAGLCELGIQGFLRSVRLHRRASFPGRVLALLSFFDKQVAYAMFVAHLRTQAAGTRTRIQIGEDEANASVDYDANASIA